MAPSPKHFHVNHEADPVHPQRHADGRIEKHILEKLEKLEHIDRWLLDARVTLEKDHTAHSPDKQFKCGIRVGIRGNDLYAEDSEADLYAAIDRTIAKLSGQVRKKHNKAKAKKHSVASTLKERRRTT
ncbi:MAG: ribosome-associated translation inhibitor RaiA [Verrucomicrobia bacterium]|nr:MAG: ribosome-associated translation inhibitor RaiA [Verrucomicrobiota bacterium]